MIDVKNKVDCCGCNACGDICAQNAISFKADEEGFWYPSVDKNKCTDCGLCEYTCPIININTLKKNDFNEPECYAAINKNVEARFGSASGGLYSVLAEKTLRDGGYVAGVKFNDDYSLRFVIINDKSELKTIRGSKYLQADAQGFYRAVKDLLIKGERVFVCGCPCQMAALRAYLHKEYDNLIIADIICLGINSPKIFRRYLDYQEEKYGSKIIDFKAKNKELGWKNLTSKIIFADGRVLYDTKDTNYYTIGFTDFKLISRPSCYECKFKGFPRIADITIGDFWGIDKIDKEMDDDLGTSAVIINSKKGKAYYETLEKNVKEKGTTLNDIIRNNPAIIEPIKSTVGINRDVFYKDLNELASESIVKKYTRQNISKRKMVKNMLSFILAIINVSHFSITTLYRNIKYNFFDKRFNTDVFKAKYIIINRKCIFDIAKTAKIEINGIFNFGFRMRYPSSNLETRMMMEDNSTLIVDDDLSFGYGGDLVMFHDAKLYFGGNTETNINSNIICGEEISIGKYTMLGRNVTIRDNNGGHVLSLRGYKNNRPISIGQHCWLCEGCTLIGGAKLGYGVIVSAGSVVNSHIPSASLISGNPAKVVEGDIYWKY